MEKRGKQNFSAPMKLKEARFSEFGCKKRQVGNLDPELSNQENFSANE